MAQELKCGEKWDPKLGKGFLVPDPGWKCSSRLQHSPSWVGMTQNLPVWAAAPKAALGWSCSLLFICAGDGMDTIWTPLVGSVLVIKSG